MEGYTGPTPDQVHLFSSHQSHATRGWQTLLPHPSRRPDRPSISWSWRVLSADQLWQIGPIGHSRRPSPADMGRTRAAHGQQGPVSQGLLSTTITLPTFPVAGSLSGVMQWEEFTCVTSSECWWFDGEVRKDALKFGWHWCHAGLHFKLVYVLY